MDIADRLAAVRRTVQDLESFATAARPQGLPVRVLGPADLAPVAKALRELTEAVADLDRRLPSLP
jgi:hypothetical protein